MYVVHNDESNNKQRRGSRAVGIPGRQCDVPPGHGADLDKPTITSRAGTQFVGPWSVECTHVQVRYTAPPLLHVLIRARWRNCSRLIGTSFPRLRYHTMRLAQQPPTQGGIQCDWELAVRRYRAGECQDAVLHRLDHLLSLNDLRRLSAVHFFLLVFGMLTQKNLGAGDPLLPRIVPGSGSARPPEYRRRPPF